jgi:peptidoglycan-N-acetylglucosamine deacetylase
VRRRCATAGRHLNHLPVTHVYGQLVDVIRSRNLRTVTLDDVFAKPGQRA